jgi:hypothetical protein
VVSLGTHTQSTVYYSSGLLLPPPPPSFSFFLYISGLFRQSMLWKIAINKKPQATSAKSENGNIAKLSI